MSPLATNHPNQGHSGSLLGNLRTIAKSQRLSPMYRITQSFLGNAEATRRGLSGTWPSTGVCQTAPHRRRTDWR